MITLIIYSIYRPIDIGETHRVINTPTPILNYLLAQTYPKLILNLYPDHSLGINLSFAILRNTKLYLTKYNRQSISYMGITIVNLR